MFLSLQWLPETLPKQRRNNASILTAFSNYSLLLKNREFTRYTLCVTLHYISAYAFITGSPFVYINYFHVDSQHYGWLFALNIVGVMLVSFKNRPLVKRYSLDTLLKVTTALTMADGDLGQGSFRRHIHYRGQCNRGGP